MEEFVRKNETIVCAYCSAIHYARDHVYHEKQCQSNMQSRIDFGKAQYEAGYKRATKQDCREVGEAKYSEGWDDGIKEGRKYIDDEKNKAWEIGHVEGYNDALMAVGKWVAEKRLAR